MKIHMNIHMTVLMKIYTNINMNIHMNIKGWTEKIMWISLLPMSLEETFCKFFNRPINAEYENDPIPQFQDNFWTKIFDKPWGGLKLKVSIFIEVFEGSNHPLWVGPALSGWWKTFFGWWILFGWCCPSLAFDWNT